MGSLEGVHRKKLETSIYGMYKFFCCCSTVVPDTMAGTGCRSVLVFLHSAMSS